MADQLSDGERGQLAQRLDQLAEAVSREQLGEFDMRVPAEPQRDADLVLSRDAQLLRQSAPVSVPADLTPTRYFHSASGATIERTRTKPDAWAVRRGSDRMSTCGGWSIEPRPSERTGGYLVEHSFTSPQAALAVLQHCEPRQGGEVQS